MDIVALLTAISAYFFPRSMLVMVYLFSHVLDHAFPNAVIPIVGFFAAPRTTLAYAWALHTEGTVQGLGLFVIILAAIIDIAKWSKKCRCKSDREYVPASA